MPYDYDSDESDDHVEEEIVEEDVVKALSAVLLDDDDEENCAVDSDLVDYLAGMVVEMEPDDHCQEGVREAMGPFLESSGCEEDVVQRACAVVVRLYHRDHASASANNVAATHSATNAHHQHHHQQQHNSDGGIRKLKGTVSMMASEQNAAEEDANRFLWGKEGVSYNTQRDAHRGDPHSAKALRKQRQELEKTRKEYDKKMKSLLQQEAAEGASGAAVSSMVLPDYESGRNERDIQVRNVSLSLDNGRSLLDDATVKFSYQRRYGLVGKNGIGKTTLLKAIASLEIKDFPRHHRVLHVRQEIKGIGIGTHDEDHDNDNGELPTPQTTTTTKEPTVLATVLAADVERTALLDQEKDLLKRLEKDDATNHATSSSSTSLSERRKQLQQQQEESNDNNASFSSDLAELDKVYARLDIIGGDGAESRAAMILSGLQFTTSMQDGPVSALSGGWRMRVSLAAALFIEPDLLLLDEPTNHLDLEAVLWLESYLVQYRHSLVVVSHDRGFLNEVVTDIIEFKDKKLIYYKGDYDTYIKTSTEAVRNSMRVYQAYMDKRAHMMEFIDKFRFNAKRASLVQSRIKAVDKMDLEAPPPVEVEQLWRFSVPNPEPLGRPIISVDDVTFDYEAANYNKGSGNNEEKKATEDYLLQKVNFGVDLDSRIGIMGANGAGKSTLLNLIMGKLNPIRGSISRNGRLRIAYFTQHSADKFELEKSAVENMLSIFEGTMDQEMRSFLGKFQIQGTDALKPMLMLSGGQKSRVAFACLAYQRPHVIVMDEPTNHLDMESIDALVEAISDFKGGLMVVSHDQYFITKTCKELWVVGSGVATLFRGGFSEYKKHTLNRTAKRVAESVKSLSTLNN